MEILRNAIFYIESLEILLSDHEKEERKENMEEEEQKRKEETGNVLSESKKVDGSDKSLTSKQKNYQSKISLKFWVAIVCLKASQIKHMHVIEHVN